MIIYSAPGESVDEMKPGDFVLTHGSYFTSKLIRFGQGLRFPKEYAYYNHAALVRTSDGYLAEALGSGVVTTHISRYTPKEYTLVRIDASDEDRDQISWFARSVEEARWRYGYSTIVSVGFSVLTGSKFVFGKVGTAICSGFVAEALTRAGYIFNKPPSYMTPADLAMYFDVSGYEDE